MRELQVQPVEAGDDRAVEAWYRTYLGSETHERKDASPYRLEEIRGRLRRPGVHHWFGIWSGLLDGEVVAAGFVDLPLRDNLTLAHVEVQVLPELRRRGHGRALLAVLEAEAAARGRSTAFCELAGPLDGPPEVTGTAAAGFATAHGYTFSLADIQRRAPLPIDPGLLARLATEAAGHHAGYRILTFHGTVPDEHVEGYAALAASLLVEAPMGELQLEAEDPSVAGWRDREEAMASQGLSCWHALALAPDGSAVAYSTVAVSAYDRGLCDQWGTLVLPGHRGHRLGLAVKVANHRAMQEAGVDVAEVATWNAEVNGPMIAVNELLGYRPVGRAAEYQKAL